MLRSLAVVLALVSVSACSIPTSTRPAAIAGGITLATVGAVIATPRQVDLDGNGVNETFIDDDWSGLLPGALMVVAGAALIGAGLRARDAVEAPQAPAPRVAVRARAVRTVSSSLPERPVTVEVLRLAQQVSTANDRGECDDAWTIWRMVQERDPAYADALVASPAMASCMR